jgi:hypothetical protein
LDNLLNRHIRRGGVLGELSAQLSERYLPAGLGDALFATGACNPLCNQPIADLLAGSASGFGALQRKRLAALGGSSPPGSSAAPDEFVAADLALAEGYRSSCGA